MTLVEIIEMKYAQANRDIDKIIAKRPDTAQARYDRKKALARGREPKRYTAGMEKMKHELAIERRWILKGILEAVDYLVDECGFIKKDLLEVIGDVEAALDKRDGEDA